MANIYFVDPVDGDNANDGSKPDKAIKDLWSDNVDYGDKDDPSVFYIKRGTELVIPEDNDKDLPFGIIMSWPHSNDGKYWDNRPDAGKDKWDDDDSARANFYAENKSHISLPDDVNNNVSFKNIDLHFSDRSDDWFIQLKNSKLAFIDCDIQTGDGFNSRDKSFIMFRQKSSDTELDYTLNFIRTKINGEKLSLIGYYNNDDCLYKKTINVIDCEFDIYNFVWADGDYDAYYGDNYLNCSNSNIICGRYFWNMYGHRSYSNGSVWMNIDNCYIKSDIWAYIGNSDYTMYHFIVKTKQTKIISTSDKNGIIYNAVDSDDITHYLDIEFLDCVLEGERLVYYASSTDDLHFKANLANNEFKNMGCMFDFYRVYDAQKILITNNKYTNIGTIFYCHHGDWGGMKNATLVEDNIIIDNVFKGYSTGNYVKLTNSVVNNMVSENSNQDFISLLNCSVGPILGNANIEILNSELRQNGDAPIKEVNGYIENSIISNDDYDILGGSGKITLFKCSISGGINNVSQLNSSYKFYNCKLGDDHVSYSAKIYGLNAIVAAPYRINGSEFSLLLEKIISGRTFCGTDELFCLFDPDKPTLTTFFATSANISLEETKIAAVFNDKDGPKLEYMQISEDKDSDWDGLTDDYKFYKASIDLSDYDINEGETVKISYQFIHEKKAKFYLDTLIKQDS